MDEVPPSIPPSPPGAREPVGSAQGPSAGLPPEQARIELVLLPGAFLVTAAPTCITAMLSTCVSVCLWDARERVAAVSHFAMPYAEGRSQPGRYGDTSTRLLLEELRRRDCEPARLEAKVYGGAHLERGRLRVGERNVAVALEVLREAGVRLCAADVGGGRSRRLIFLTDLGRAWVRHL